VTTPDRPQHLVEQTLAEAGRLAGVRGCTVLVEQSGHVDLRWAMNSLTTNGVTTGQSVSVAVIADVAGGQGVGAVTRPAVTAADLPALVADALAAARDAAPAEDANPLTTGGTDPGWEEPAGSTGPSTLASVSKGLGEVFARSKAEQRESFGFAEHDVSTSWLGTSGGVRFRHFQPRGTIELNGKSHGRSRSSYLARATRDFADLDVVALDEEVRSRLDWQQRRVELPPGRYDTVLPPTAVADLLIYLYWVSEGRSAFEGRSVFSRPGGGTLVGDRITPVPLSLSSDPDRPGLECAARVAVGASSPYASIFDNGLPSPAVNWLTDGVLTALPTTRHSAELAGLPFAPMVGNLMLTGADGAGGVDELVAGLEHGLLLTCLWYIREVDPMTLLLTGLTRDGVYLVEGGEVTGAVTNFRFNESPVDLLRRVQATGLTEPTLSREWGEWFSRTAMPALRVSGFNMSSVSEAS
jgi:predicted Zn-dependent protease